MMMVMMMIIKSMMMLRGIMVMMMMVMTIARRRMTTTIHDGDDDDDAAADDNHKRHLSPQSSGSVVTTTCPAQYPTLFLFWLIVTTHTTHITHCGQRDWETKTVVSFCTSFELILALITPKYCANRLCLQPGRQGPASSSGFVSWSVERH